MVLSIVKRPEQDIKAQFSKIFVQRDWVVFKKLAEYYLKQAARIKKADIDVTETNSLWIRNVQKRLFIGIACELLLKAAYLKCGLIINKPKDRKVFSNVNYKLGVIPEKDLKIDDSYTFNQLLDNYSKTLKISNTDIFEKGFRIAKVFRNKEGHVAIQRHKYKKENYLDIERALVVLYKDIFNRTFKYRISFENDEPYEFEIKK